MPCSEIRPEDVAVEILCQTSGARSYFPLGAIIRPINRYSGHTVGCRIALVDGVISLVDEPVTIDIRETEHA